MQRTGKILVIALLAVLSGCGAGGNTEETSARKFPYPSVPAAISEPKAQTEYFVSHFWKSYLSDSRGVDSLQVDEAVSNYIGMLQEMPVAKAQELIAALHSDIEAAQAADPESGIYSYLTGRFSLYLYDTQSPMRDEDLYLPFVSAMASSEYTPDKERASLENTVRMCSINRYGTPAADFEYRTADGRNHRLHGLDAEYVIMFFTNPGCAACKDIRAGLESDLYVEGMIDEGRIAVLNIFIDEDLDSWRENLVNYPSNWINGYDPHYIIREDEIYSIRAIPSIYLLDCDKNVLLKDAEMARLIYYIKKHI